MSRAAAARRQLLWYLYSANRLKYPLMRKRLRSRWREAKHPVAPGALSSAMRSSQSYKVARGRGGFVRSSWQEVNELIAAANVYTAKTFGRTVSSASPIPAMSMVSYAAGARYLSLIGGACLSFYDWYCDLPPASPMTWGEQTDVPESADWYNSSYIIAWGSNVPQTRTGRPLLYRSALQGHQNRGGDAGLCRSRQAVRPLAESEAGHRQRAMALAMGHVMLKEFHLDREVGYFRDYAPLYRYADAGAAGSA